MDIAKSIALGADAAGMALPLLRAAAESQEALHAKIMQLKEELETVMFCTGSKTVADLHQSAVITKLQVS
jgi:isopentenyl-diphosphate delta-isomerase